MVSNQPLVELDPPLPGDLQATDRSDVVAEHDDGFTEEGEDDIMTLIRHELEKFLAAQHSARPGGGPVYEVAATPSNTYLGAGDRVDRADPGPSSSTEEVRSYEAPIIEDYTTRHHLPQLPPLPQLPNNEGYHDTAPSVPRQGGYCRSHVGPFCVTMHPLPFIFICLSVWGKYLSNV